jgi:hypothetical protein
MIETVDSYQLSVDSDEAMKTLHASRITRNGS